MEQRSNFRYSLRPLVGREINLFCAWPRPEAAIRRDHLQCCSRGPCCRSLGMHQLLRLQGCVPQIGRFQNLGLECAPRIGQIERLAIDRGRAF